LLAAVVYFFIHPAKKNHRNKKLKAQEQRISAIKPHPYRHAKARVTLFLPRSTHGAYNSATQSLR
jgi:hypothetical protein